MGGWSLEWQLRVPGGNQRWTGRPSIAGPLSYTHTHSDWGNVDIPHHLTCTSLGVGGNQSRENPHRHGEIGQTLQRQWPLPGTDFFSCQSYNKIILLKDLFYLSQNLTILVDKDEIVKRGELNHIINTLNFTGMKSLYIPQEKNKIYTLWKFHRN